MATDDSFPPTLDQVPPDVRLSETFGILPGTTAIACLLGTIGFFFDSTTPIVNVLPQVIGLIVVAAVLLGWEVMRRSDRTTLVVAERRIGIYRGNSFAEVVSRNQLVPIDLNALRTMRLAFPSAAVAMLGLGIGFFKSSGTFLALGFIGSAVFGSAMYSRTLCRHFEIPKGSGTERVIFRANIVSRLDGLNLLETPAQNSSLPSELRNILFVGVFLVLVPAIGGLAYYFQTLNRNKSAQERADAWIVNYQVADELLTIEVQGAPIGAKINALGKDQTCDDHCRLSFSRRELKPGQLKVDVELTWNGRSTHKSVTREPWKPLVTVDTLDMKESTEKLACEVSTSTKARPLPIQAKYNAQGLTFHAKGAAGDMIVIDRRTPDEPGAGKDYTIANNDLLGMLTLKPLLFPLQNIDISVPISIESVDGTKEKIKIICNGNALRSYLLAEFKAAHLSAYASSAPKSGSLVVGDALFFVGESASPWDALVIAAVEKREVSSHTCKYDGGYEVSYRWHDHAFHAYELRNGKDLGTKRFSSAKPGSWTCPVSAGSRAGEKSRSEDMPPNGDELAQWFNSVAPH